MSMRNRFALKPPSSAKREGDAAVLSERSDGSVSRAFRLSQAVDAELATARHDHGVLTLTLPKKNVAVQKRLAIN